MVAWTISSSRSTASRRRSARGERSAGSSTCSTKAHLTVDGALEDAQVLGAQSRRGELGRGPHDAGVDLAVALDAAHLVGRDQLVLLELFEQRSVRAGHAQDLLTHELAFFARGDAGRPCAAPAAPPAPCSPGCAPARDG